MANGNETMDDSSHYEYGSLTSWDQAEPSFLGVPQFFPSIRYTVTPGTFVTAEINDRKEIFKILSNPVSEGNITTGRPINQQGRGASSVKVNLYSRLERVLTEYAAESIQLEPDVTTQSVHTRGVDEIVQTRFYLWIDTSAINGFAFPFHQEDIDSGLSNVTGMDLAFVLRYRLSLDCTSLEEISRDSFKTFPSEYQDHNMAFRKSSDVSRKVYNALSCIRLELGKMLCTSSLSEGTWNKKTHKFDTFPEEAWEFITSYAEPQVEAVTVNRKRTIGMIRSLLELTSYYRRLMEVEVLHFEDDEALDHLNSLLGSAICFGLRGRAKPKAGKSFSLAAGNNINYVTSSRSSTESATVDDEERQIATKAGPSRFGIFLHYDIQTTQMTLGVYYEALVIRTDLYESEEPQTKRLRVFLDEMRKKGNGEDDVFALPPDPSEIALHEGLDFQDENQMFIIKSHGNGCVVAHKADSRGKTAANSRAYVYSELQVQELIMAQQ